MLTYVDIIDQETLIDLYTSEKEIQVTTDGGVHKGNGTFGVIVSNKANPVVLNHGKLYSPKLYESSYRSEASGVLAGIITLQHPLEALNIQLPKGKTIIIHCDNKSVIKRIEERRKKRITVNQHNCTDIDIELQIIEEIKALQEKEIMVTIKHVQRYKKRNSTTELSVEKQMHKMADELCKQAREHRDQTTYHKMPANNVSFVLKDQTITANISKATMIAYHSMSL
jgi:hypothetical protein